MDIRTGNITIENHDSRVWITEEYLGHLLAFSFAHYPAYLIEVSYQYEKTKYRKIILAPNIKKDYDKWWFEEYLTNLISEGYNIHGVQALNEIELPEYEQSKDYKEYAQRQEEMWKGLHDE